MNRGMWRKWRARERRRTEEWVPPYSVHGVCANAAAMQSARDCQLSMVARREDRREAESRAVPFSWL